MAPASKSKSKSKSPRKSLNGNPDVSTNEPANNNSSLDWEMGDDVRVQPARFRVLERGKVSAKGPVIYWMFKDQRSKDNWALIHAVEQANRIDAPVAVAFNLFDQFLGAKARHLGFMLRGLRELEQSLQALQIPFFLLQGEAVDNIPNFLNRLNASMLVTDFTPLRDIRRRKHEICEKLSDSVAVHEVDAHNIVPVWIASNKLEYSARTIRTKIHKLLPQYLVEYPEWQSPHRKWTLEAPSKIDWENLIADVVRKGAEVPELKWCEPGELAAKEVLMGNKNGFLTTRLKNYSVDRNNPLKPKALSGLSPYLHFGQISAQRCALEARNFRKVHPQSVDAFLEEMIVRRELANNFCFYQPQYDSLQGAWEWARKTLLDHAADEREHIYTKEELEKAKTADPLWNASQLEMVHHGKMHGFMRMYWAKKILEWTNGPEEALSIAISLNDKYQIDGRDPNGYVGCLWSICGVHDQGWQERPVFGKIRYMNYAGCKRKFDVDGYINYVKRLVDETKKRKQGSLTNFYAEEPKKRRS
ncbi:deoxyribodipyrimidine photo-lyase [Aristolochia californica]|uniref:deoxyribodipyrimidine photo-lyase n=1 Tax=Aristolochia californica TaxID=171875 RepID=UPI0035DD4EA7